MKQIVAMNYYERAGLCDCDRCRRSKGLPPNGVIKMKYVAQERYLDEAQWRNVDMREVKLETDDDVRQWVIGPGTKYGHPMGPGYLKTHPELEGHLIQVVVEEEVLTRDTGV